MVQSKCYRSFKMIARNLIQPFKSAVRTWFKKAPLVREFSYITIPWTIPNSSSSIKIRAFLSGLKLPASQLLNENNDCDIFTKNISNYSAEYSEKGMTVNIDMTGFKEEDVNVKVEGPWLVVEGNLTTAVPEKEGGGLLIRNVIRRYEIPPHADVSNIKMKFKDKRLVISIPSLTPSVYINVKDVEKKNITVGVEGNFLVVDAHASKDIPGGKALRQIYRQYRLSPHSDLKNIQATYTNQQLKVHVPSTVPVVKWAEEEKDR